MQPTTSEPKLHIPYHGHEPIPIVYLDNHLLVIDKPAGLLSQADSSGDVDVLTLSKKWLAEYFNKPGNVFLGLVHRLDRPVSGLMVLARTSKSASRLSEQIRNKQWKKIYWAVVYGQVADGRLAHYLKKDTATNKSRVVSSTVQGAKKATLAVKSLAYEPVKALSLLEIDLGSGRSHQIRVQLAANGTPIVGDHKYGVSQKKNKLSKDPCLRASRLEILHPTQKTPLIFEVAAPNTQPWNLFRDEG